MRTKEIVFSALLLFSGFLAGFGWDKIPQEPWWAAALLFYAVFFGFFLLFAVNFWLRIAVPLLSLLLTASALGPNIFSFTGFGAGAVFVLFAVWEAEKEYEASTEFYLKKIVGKSLKLFFTGLALVFAFAYYGNIQGSDAVSLLIPKEIFSRTLEALEKPLAGFFPGLAPGAVVDTALPEEQREQLSRELGVAIEPGETVSDVLYKFSLARIAEFTRPYSAYIDVLAAASFFFALKFVSILIYYIVLILMGTATWAFLYAKVFEKVSVPTKKEILV